MTARQKCPNETSEVEGPRRSRMAWRLSCWALAALAVYFAFLAWSDWDWEPAAFVTDVALIDPSVVLTLFKEPGAWWLAYPLFAALAFAGFLLCLSKAMAGASQR